MKKATISGLAALLVSLYTLNAASAQTPYPYPNMTTGYGAPATHAGPVAGTTAAGGCDCNGHHGLLGKLGLKSGTGCGAGLNGGCGGLCSAMKGWLCRPYPSNAPACLNMLGFAHHPYVRSPRDYFMHDNP